MLIFSFTAAILIILVWLFSIFFESRVKIGSELYNQIMLSNNLTADILPPPEYILESYSTALEYITTSDTQTQNELLSYFKQLKSDYEERNLLLEKYFT